MSQDLHLDNETQATVDELKMDVPDTVEEFDAVVLKNDFANFVSAVHTGTIIDIDMARRNLDVSLDQYYEDFGRPRFEGGTKQR